jgi:hypothetical protein
MLTSRYIELEILGLLCPFLDVGLQRWGVVGIEVQVVSRVYQNRVETAHFPRNQQSLAVKYLSGHEYKPLIQLSAYYNLLLYLASDSLHQV